MTLVECADSLQWLTNRIVAGALSTSPKNWLNFPSVNLLICNPKAKSFGYFIAMLMPEGVPQFHVYVLLRLI